jgi:coenzyme F420 hydrogenase subunit beta
MYRHRKLSFDTLQKDVIDQGLCGRCGGCVSFCTADRIGALEMGPDGFPRYSSVGECLECGLCYLICPQTAELNEDVEERHDWKAPIGPVIDVFSLRATGHHVREAATDGGLVTALLTHMLETGVIDGAVVSRQVGLFQRESIVATSPGELLDAAGSSFSEAPHLEHVGEGYTSCVPIARTIREYSDRKFRKLAVVGTPCQIDAVRKMQVLNILPSDVIQFTVGLFCMQCFSLDRLIGSPFLKAHGIELEHLRKINVKKDFYLHMESGDVIHVPLEEIESIARPACLACKRFSNDFADISVGGLGSPEGYTTAVVRTTRGKASLANALYDGALAHRPLDEPQTSAREKDRMLDLIIQYSKMKRARGEKTLASLKSNSSTGLSGEV